MALSDKQAVGRNLWSWPMEYQEKPAYREALERFFHAAYAAGVTAEREAILQMSREQWFKTQADFEEAIRARGKQG